MSVQCRCGRECEPDIDAWVAEQLDRDPDADVAALAASGGVPLD
jgi:hypothetical protein